MAKLGEGDPRWIVEIREDGTNVNNWHWKEKDATGWSRVKLKELLEGLRVTDDKVGYCEIREVTKCEGEASVNNRKAKIFFFYEFVVKADWKGQVNGDSKRYKGSLEVPNLSEENSADELDVIVTSSTEKPNALVLKELLRLKGTPLIQERLAEYTKQLKEVYSRGLILPSKGSSSNLNAPQSSNTQQQTSGEQRKASSKPTPTQPTAQATKQQTTTGVKIHTAKFTTKEDFKCGVDDLYRVFLEYEMVAAFTRSPVQLQPEVSGRFTLYQGNVTGKFVELEKNRKIVMLWRLRNWPPEHYSTVTLVFEQEDDCAALRLTQTGVPEDQLGATERGWAQYYWEPIRQTFGYGARFF